MRTETERLILRPWERRDLEPFAALNADPEVMQFFPAQFTREETAAYIERVATLTDQGLGFQAVEEKVSGDLVGVVGMAPVKPEFPSSPGVEIGWRLAKAFWGKGYASEAAAAWLHWGFEELNLDEIVAFTFSGNLPSRRVMERLGMSYDPADDFEHPSLAEGHRLKPHVLYRLKRADFRPRAGRS
ncbi:GNAT family N-acetyltransferase [Kaistia dalseonensis]|uniref:RimJ/RimL family protein N-acetyltransferase n=1 Tax=Kaistia dalseonensis TaxID=410840 RepID=A0ABU0HDC0_9HYPH|nr:GNAT family N-acetyltransferase [Kaistia dalseonensis]MCX5497094.1 GNAT family N-acetyltransferase [Kaistia dalseonensis]MDQ0439720.1 RimJ/RimL family protein N-acetyltransferase [Kaistia dalseonensis]